MKVYISIPISGHDEAEVREHADLTRAMLSRAGHEVVTPFDIYAGENPKYEDYLSEDLKVLYRCDAVYLCEGWQFSKGCQIEAYYAHTFGKVILYEHQPENPSVYYFER